MAHFNSQRFPTSTNAVPLPVDGPYAEEDEDEEAEYVPPKGGRGRGRGPRRGRGEQVAPRAISQHPRHRAGDGGAWETPEIEAPTRRRQKQQQQQQGGVPAAAMDDGVGASGQLRLVLSPQTQQQLKALTLAISKLTSALKTCDAFGGGGVDYD